MHDKITLRMLPKMRKFNWKSIKSHILIISTMQEFIYTVMI